MVGDKKDFCLRPWRTPPSQSKQNWPQKNSGLPQSKHLLGVLVYALHPGVQILSIETAGLRFASLFRNHCFFQPSSIPHIVFVLKGIKLGQEASSQLLFISCKSGSAFYSESNCLIEYKINRNRKCPCIPPSILCPRTLLCILHCIAKTYSKEGFCLGFIIHRLTQWDFNKSTEGLGAGGNLMRVRHVTELALLKLKSFHDLQAFV